MASFRLWNAVQSWALIPSWRRAWFLRRIGIDCAKSCGIKEGCFFGSKKIRIGPKCFINHQCYFDGSDWIVLEEEVHIGQRVTILTGTHEIGSINCLAGVPVNRPVMIGKGCWIGAGAMIMPGVTLAPGCIVAAGAVVVRDTDPDGIYTGVPASRMRDADPAGRFSHAPSAGA